MLPAADGVRGPWKRILVGNGCIARTLAPVLRGRVGIADEGGGRRGGLRHHRSRLLVRCTQRFVPQATATNRPPSNLRACAPARSSVYAYQPLC